jgi:hypothetical protein
VEPNAGHAPCRPNSHRRTTAEPRFLHKRKVNGIHREHRGEPRQQASGAEQRCLPEEDEEDTADHRIAHVPIRPIDDEPPRWVPGSERPTADGDEQADRPDHEHEAECDQRDSEDGERAQRGIGLKDDEGRHTDGDDAGQQKHRGQVPPEVHT